MLVFNWGWIGIALVALVTGFVGGCVHEKRELDLYKAQVEATAAAQQRIADDINKANKQKSKEVASEYEKRIAAIRGSYRGLYNNGARGLSGNSEAAKRIDGFPSYSVLAESCAETTQQLVSLQDFIKETR